MASGDRVLRRLLGDAAFGRITYWLRPHTRAAWGGPMNGQEARRRMVTALIAATRPCAIIETGTFRGTTTEWLAGFDLPVYTCEASGEHHAYARARLRSLPHVHLANLDSRAALEHVLDGPLAPRRAEPLLVYLDAHWHDDLPLADEIDIVFARAPRAVVVIDDFAVPDDPGYAHDDYGPGKALRPDYIADHIVRHGLAAFYPSAPSASETGARRGCVVLAMERHWGETLDGLPDLRRG